MKRTASRGVAAALAAVVAGALVGGCGAGPAPSGASPSASPGSSGAADATCDLAPSVAELVGRAGLAPPTAFRVGDLDRCTWIFGADPARSVDLTVGPARTHDEAIVAFGAGETVAELGDDARWWATSRTLSVRLGEAAFQVGLQLDPADVDRDLAVAIGREVAGRLP